MLASPQLNVVGDGKMHEYVIHATQDLRPAGPGDLRIAYVCPVGTVVTWGGGEMVKPEVTDRWRALVLPDTGRQPSYTPSPSPR